MKTRLMLAGLLALLGVAGLVVIYRSEPGEGSILPPCVFHKVTGFHCAGCGITRATRALLHFRFGEAFSQNPLLVLALPLVAVAVAVEARAWVAGPGYRGPRVRLPRWGHWALLATIIAYWVLRNVPVWPFVLLAPH